MSHLPKLDSLPDPGDRFTLEEIIGSGVYAKVHKAIDNQADGKFVAIKVQPYKNNLIPLIQEEYRVYRDFNNHPNLPNFYGVYLNKTSDGNEIWFVLEYCEGGPIIDLIRGLSTLNKRISEEHIAYILREAAKAVLHLHEHHVIHRDICGNNILITGEGEIKLCDFGLSQDLKSTLGKRGTCLGSPCYMAPEIVTCKNDDEEVYGSRADVWALGITAIELGDTKPPFADMHPTRILFQIVRNPPPTLYRPANWTQTYNDFISECLEKNQEHRPYLVELMEHPFFTELPENDYHLQQELKHFLSDMGPITAGKQEEVSIHKDTICKPDFVKEKMIVEDLAALDKLTEERILDELQFRMERGATYTFVGDVLLSLNSNEIPTEYKRAFHNKYLFKSRSDNAPHVFAVADSAYQDMLHHEESQHIVLAGESYSGKTTNYRHLISHLTILGDGNKGISNRVKYSSAVIQAFVNAGTPVNADSTKCVMQTQLTFGTSGKMSGAIFWVFLLEKLRVSSTDMLQSNFHIFYYFYDTMDAEERLKDFQLESGRQYRYLRIPDSEANAKFTYPRMDPPSNVTKMKEIERMLFDLELTSGQIETIYNILAAILILGDVRFKDGTENVKMAELEDPDVAQKVARLLKVDEKKFQWALLNYCVVEKGSAERRRHTADEARDARDVLAATIYSRLADWIVNTINHKLALSRAMFGDLYSITITDMFGFECFKRNRFEQLMINCLNEQMQYQYNQRMFAFEMIDLEEEMIPGVDLHYHDNKMTIDNLMAKPNGLFCMFDEVSKGRHGYEFLTEAVANRKNSFIQRVSAHEFSIAHFTGKVTYDVRDLADKNRDFVPPEMVDTLRSSTEPILKTLFTNQLSKTGNLTMEYTAVGTKKNAMWGAALVAEKSSTQKLNTLSHGQYSQVHKMRTLAGVFRATSLEMLRGLAIGANTGGTHYIRCIRADLEYAPRGFQTEMIRQQMRAMAILDTALAKQKGFSHRIPFQEFLRRYKFLAFEFDENVELTKDNCRLLLIRLKLEGWVIGTSKVFLKYYNEEYLSRLYETQVKKIVKVQAMMRAFLAKRNVASKLKKFRRQESDAILIKSQPTIEMSEEEAVIKIQKAFRGYVVRKRYGPLINERTGKLDEETMSFISHFAKKWRSKTIYQVLIHYRAARFQDLVNFSQQVHIFNQLLVHKITMNTSQCLPLDRIDISQTHAALLGPQKPSVWKIKFRLDEIPYFDTTYLCDPTQLNSNYAGQDSDDEDWDAPLRRRATLSYDIIKRQTAHNYMFDCKEVSDYDEMVTMEPFTRDPDMPMKRRAPNPPKIATPAVQSPPASESYSNLISPMPYAQPCVGEIRSKFSNSNNSSIDKKSVVYKKKPVAPKVPVQQSPKPELKLKKRIAPPRPNDNLNWEPKDGDEFSYSALEAPFSYATKINPIKEMKLIGQRNTIDEKDENDPPFNFQGMLRKTKYNRASMKRISESTMTVYQSTPTTENNNEANKVVTPVTVVAPDIENNNSNPKTVRSHTPDDLCLPNVVYNSKTPARPKSCQDNIRLMSYANASIDMDLNDNHNNEMNIGTYIKEEILPGIILEGYVAHL